MCPIECSPFQDLPAQSVFRIDAAAPIAAQSMINAMTAVPITLIFCDRK
jgi:hypothetical protein